MWHWRRRRLPPHFLLPSLDRLAELIERVVALLDQVSLAPTPAPAAALPAPEPTAASPPAQAGHVLFLPAAGGYRLVQRAGSPPDRGAAVELDEVVFRVLRLGPSPLPGDPRRCAFVERQEPSATERNLDG